ncbi:MAG TPA: hypothetical protein VGR41_06225 [Actinomycetota bacterium]|nr:hypothetical protein [Actinomycetota bacterium]
MSDGVFLFALGTIGLILAVLEIVKGSRIDKAVGGSSYAQEVEGGFPTRWLGVGLLFGSLVAIAAGVVLLIRG